MDGGEILQYGAPDELYFQPKSRFVARFLGEANLIEVSEMLVQGSTGSVAKTGLADIPLDIDPDGFVDKSGNLALVLRPEDLVLTTDGNVGPDMVPPIEVRIEKELFLGSRCLVTVSNAHGQVLCVECGKSSIPASETRIWLTWKRACAVLIDR